MAQTAAYLGRFLQVPSENTHATLIALFMNAVDEAMTKADEMSATMKELKTVVKYLPLAGVPTKNSGQAILKNLARALVRDMDTYFDR